MEIRCEYQDNIVVMRLAGEIDMATVDQLIEEILETKKRYHKFIFDFQGINFIDSTGVGKFIKLLMDHPDVNFAISNLQPEVKEIFEILNLKEILNIKAFYASNEEALKILGAK